MGRVNFTQKAEAAVNSVQPARHTAQPAPDWSDLESRLRELATLSSELSSRLAVEPHVTLAHDPHDPLALFEQLNRRNSSAPVDRSAPADSQTAIKSSTAIDPPTRVDHAEPTGEPQPPGAEHGRDPLQLLSLLAATPSKQS